MAWVIYDKVRLAALDPTTGAGVDFENDTIKIAQLKTAYTPAQATDEFWSDILANQCSGTNYPAGGQSVTPTCEIDAAGLITFDVSDPGTMTQNAGGIDETTPSLAAVHAVIYQDTGVTTTSRLIAYHTYAADRGNVGQDFAVQIDTAGVFTQAR